MTSSSVGASRGNRSTTLAYFFMFLCLIYFFIPLIWLALASFLLPRAWQESGRRRVQRRRVIEPERARRHRNTMLATRPSISLVFTSSAPSA